MFSFQIKKADEAFAQFDASGDDELDYKVNSLAFIFNSQIFIHTIRIFSIIVEFFVFGFHFSTINYQIFIHTISKHLMTNLTTRWPPSFSYNQLPNLRAYNLQTF